MKKVIKVVCAYIVFAMCVWMVFPFAEQEHKPYEWSEYQNKLAKEIKGGKSYELINNEGQLIYFVPTHEGRGVYHTERPEWLTVEGEVQLLLEEKNYIAQYNQIQLPSFLPLDKVLVGEYNAIVSGVWVALLILGCITIAFRLDKTAGFVTLLVTVSIVPFFHKFYSEFAWEFTFTTFVFSVSVVLLVLFYCRKELR